MKQEIKDKLLSRKFILALIGTFVSSIALFCGIVTGTEWISAQTLIYSIFSAANVTQSVKNGKVDDTINKE